MEQSAIQEGQEGDLLLEEASTPQASVFCLSLATIHHRHTHKYTFVYSPPFLFCYFYLGQHSSVKATAVLWAEASPPHPERDERLSFLTSLRKNCNCSFPSLPLTTGVCTRNPGTHVSPHYSPQGHQLPPVLWDKRKRPFHVIGLLRCSTQRQQRR